MSCILQLVRSQRAGLLVAHTRCWAKQRLLQSVMSTMISGFPPVIRCLMCCSLQLVYPQQPGVPGAHRQGKVPPVPQGCHVTGPAPKHRPRGPRAAVHGCTRPPGRLCRGLVHKIRHHAGPFTRLASKRSARRSRRPAASRKALQGHVASAPRRHHHLPTCNARGRDWRQGGPWQSRRRERGLGNVWRGGRRRFRRAGRRRRSGWCPWPGGRGGGAVEGAGTRFAGCAEQPRASGWTK